MSESTADARRDIEATRERMSERVAELDARVTEKVDAVKQRLDVVQLVRDHPWTALAAALGAGFALSVTGSDARAAAAVSAAAQRGSRASADAVKRAAGKLRRSRATSDIDGDDDDALESMSERGAGSEVESPGLTQKLFTIVCAPFVASLDRVLDDMRVASRNVGSSLRTRAGETAEPRDSAVTTVVVVASSDATSDPLAPALEPTVPVPPEMFATELDARADAVEATEGPTTEPPLAPGAGDLGARWA